MKILIFNLYKLDAVDGLRTKLVCALIGFNYKGYANMMNKSLYRYILYEILLRQIDWFALDLGQIWVTF